ncbi:MAG: adenosylcobinamide amidohydrolase [Dehalococcoidia bacterium]
MDTDIPGIEVAVSREAIVVHSTARLRVLSSAVVGGGAADVYWIVNRHIPKGYRCREPATDLAAFAQSRGIGGPFVGLMTAALVERAQCVTIRDKELAVCCIVTAGLSNPSASGLSPPVEAEAGTINLILLVDASLGEAAMVNAVITATEAKTAVLAERQTRTAEGFPATGTSTDAVVVACTGRGVSLPYAGPVTRVGSLIGRSVRESLGRALAAR